MQQARKHPKKFQHGMILIISLMILVVVAGLSITILSTTVSEKNLAHNTQDQIIAKEAAEYAVSMAKQEITTNWGIGMTECTALGCTCPSKSYACGQSRLCYIYYPCVYQNSVFTNIDPTAQNNAWWTTNGETYYLPNQESIAQPSALIIDLGCDAASGNNLFRIIGRGTGITSNSVAFSDTTFPMPLNSQNIGSSTTYSVYGQSEQGNILLTLNMAKSTTQSFVAVAGTSSTTCPQGYNYYGECQLNCAGYVRVMAYTYESGCVNTYGAWTNNYDMSRVYLKLNGQSQYFVCGMN